MRDPVESFLELLGSGMRSEEILGEYPDLEREDLVVVFAYGAWPARVKRTVPLA